MLNINTWPLKLQTGNATHLHFWSHKPPNLLKHSLQDGICERFKRKLALFLRSCAEKSPGFLRNLPRLGQIAQCSSQQCHTGCLKVSLQILERFCVEAGAHHWWNPSGTSSRQFVKWLCQVNLGVVHHLTYGIMLSSPSKCQLWEGSLVSWCVFYVNKMFFIRNGIIFR